MRIPASLTFVVPLIFCISFDAQAQDKSIYKSDIDSQITIRKVTLLPVFDNLRGIYSRPVETYLIDFLNKGHRWEYAEANLTGPIMTPDELSDDPNLVKNISSSVTADAFIATSIIKGPSGVAIKMDMYLRNDSKLIAQESITGLQTFDVESIKRQSETMFKKIIKKLPYDGLIMSRQGTRVTVNLGRVDGVQQDQILSVVQIIRLVRHPKFNFLISTEKEVIGKVKLLKVDDTLSFGRIITEKEVGAIEVNAKIANLDDVVYTNTETLSDQTDTAEAYAQRPEGQVSFGTNPSAWLPKRKPTFGMAGASLGIGQYKESVAASSSLDAASPFYPLASIEGELWLTPVWSMHAAIKQGIITTDNPVSGGEPKELSHSMSAQEFLFGYNFRLSEVITGPKVELLAGYSSYHLYVDSSNPSGLTTKTYSGPKFGVMGSYPLPNASPWSVGAYLNFMFQAKLKETPSSSGTADNSVNSFGLFGDKALSINLKARFAINFELYSSDFGAGSTTSASQKHTTGTAGLYYMF